MAEYSDQDFLDTYFDEIGFIWWEFENKKISMTERESQLQPYRTRLYKLIKEGKVDDKFRLVERSRSNERR